MASTVFHSPLKLGKRLPFFLILQNRHGVWQFTSKAFTVFEVMNRTNAGLALEIKNYLFKL